MTDYTDVKWIGKKEESVQSSLEIGVINRERSRFPNLSI